MLVSPAEPAPLRALGFSSPIPETMGLDFAWPTVTGWVGVQRKTVDDLVGSVRDGRLARELGQIAAAGVRIAELVVEGTPDWLSNGVMLRYPTMTRAGWWGLLRSVQLGGVLVTHTASQTETVLELAAFSHWATRDVHRSLISRPGPVGAWGTPSSREWLVHFMQGFPMIGPGLAESIVDWFIEREGRLPIGWTVSEEELLAVPGLGPKRVKGLLAALMVQGSSAPSAGNGSGTASSTTSARKRRSSG